MFNQNLHLNNLILENQELYLTGKISEFDYIIKESVYVSGLHQIQLMQENDYQPQQGNHFTRNWGKYALGGTGLAMANAGALGQDAKNFVDMGKSFGHQTGEAFKHTANHYMPKSEQANTLDQHSETFGHKVGSAVDSVTQAAEDGGSWLGDNAGALGAGALGAAALGAGARYGLAGRDSKRNNCTFMG